MTFVWYCDLDMFLVVFKEPFHITVIVVTNDVVVNIN